ACLLLCAENGVFARLGDAELHDLLGRDLDRCAGERVAAHARLAVHHHELSESGDGEALLGLLVREVAQRLEHRGRRLLRDFSGFGEISNDLRFRHWACCHVSVVTPLIFISASRGKDEAMYARFTRISMIFYGFREISAGVKRPRAEAMLRELSILYVRPAPGARRIS